MRVYVSHSVGQAKIEWDKVWDKMGQKAVNALIEQSAWDKIWDKMVTAFVPWDKPYRVVP